MCSLFSAQEAFITVNSLKILKYDNMRRADLQENLFLCYNLFRRERKGYLYVCVGDRFEAGEYTQRKYKYHFTVQV